MLTKIHAVGAEEFRLVLPEDSIPDHGNTFLLGVINDQRRMIEDLLEEIKLHHTLQRASSEVTFCLDTTTNTILLMNSYSLIQMLGYTQGEFMGKNFIDIIDENYKEIFLEKKARGYTFTDFEILLKRNDGSKIPCAVTISYNPENKIESYTIKDISTTCLDKATGLPDKATFCNFFEHALHFAPRNKIQTAILMIDMNGLHAINEKSHVFADQIILEIAKLVKQNFTRKGDFPCRANKGNGDEFLVFMSDFGTMDNLQKKLYEFTQLVVTCGYSLSLGATVINWQDIPQEVTQEYIEQQIILADNAMQLAKKASKFDTSIPEDKKTEARLYASGFTIVGQKPVVIVP